VIGPSIDRPSAAAKRHVPQIRQDTVCAIQSDARVLITGMSTSGTRALAQLIHCQGQRARAPFLKINCARRPDLVLESRLFGRERHSFDLSAQSTRGIIEQAHGGTIFIANIGGIGHALQARLLHFLKCGDVRRAGADTAHARVDVRVIAAADHRLYEQVVAGTFMTDLYYRLNVIHLVMPPVAQQR
jgi:DNA-binding NtrC family response regulator